MGEALSQTSAGETEVLTRLLGAADVLGVDVTSIYVGAEHLGAELGRYARVSLTDQMRLAIMARWPKDELQAEQLQAYVASLGNRIQKRTLPALLGRAAATRFLELETTPHAERPTVLLHLVGEAAIEDDAAILARATIFEKDAGAQVARVAGMLGRSASDLVIDRAEPHAANLWTFRFRLSCESEADMTDTSGRVLAVMDHLKIEPRQRIEFEKVHGRLALGDTCLVSLVTSFDLIMPYVSVAYADKQWADVVPTMMQLYPDDPWEERLGALAGAFEAADASAFELRFRDEAPVRARVSIDWYAR